MIEECYDKLFAEKAKQEPNQEIVRHKEWEIDYWVFKLYGIVSEADINLVCPNFYAQKPASFVIE